MNFTILSIIFISVIGTISHFIYDLTNHNKVIGLFVSVNESTWEHIKIALTPSILWSIVDGYIYGIYNSYFFAKLISLFTIIILMPILFYGYKYLFKKDNFIINILIFYMVIISSQLIFNYLLNIQNISYITIYISSIGTYILLTFYMILTLMPIKNTIFKDPITKKYGFKGHRKI